MGDRLALRGLVGAALRQRRVRQGRTLRQVSAQARVSLGYISEIERGQKEASSEMLAALCAALQVPLSSLLREVSDRLAVEEARAALAAEPMESAEPAQPVVIPVSTPGGGEVVVAA